MGGPNPLMAWVSLQTLPAEVESSLSYPGALRKRLPFPKLSVLFPGAIVPGCQATGAFRCHPGDWGLGIWV